MLRRPPSATFWGLLLVGSSGSCAAYVAVLLGQTRYADVLALGGIPYHEWGYRLLLVRLSAAGLLTAQCEFLAAALALLACFGAMAATAAGRREGRLLGQELRQAGRQWVAGLRQLPQPARWVAGAALLLLTASRLVISLYSPLETDELATYDFFSSRSWLAAASFYPIPNNHLLLSVLGRAVYLLTPSYWLVLRLPVLLAATAATVGLFGGLLRVSSFRVALFALGLFGATEPALHYAANGRGYWLLIGWAGLCFLAVLALMRPRPRARLAWVGLLTGCLLGGYTVPAFAYVAASALGYLALVACRHRRWALLAQTVVLGLGVAVGTMVLYAPVALVSGWLALLHNPYVAARPGAHLWQHLPWFAWHTEGALLGFERYGAGALLLGLAGTVWLRRLPQRQALPAAQRAATGRLLGPALWFVGFPYVLQLVQQVEAPVRVLLYKGLFSALLLGLLADAWLAKRAARWPAVALGAVLLGLGGCHTAALLREAHRTRPLVATYGASLRWLLRQPPGPVLVHPHPTAFYWLVLGHRYAARQPLQLATTPHRGVQYRYVVVSTGSAAATQLARQRLLVYRDAVQSIYAEKQWREAAVPRH